MRLGRHVLRTPSLRRLETAQKQGETAVLSSFSMVFHLFSSIFHRLPIDLLDLHCFVFDIWTTEHTACCFSAGQAKQWPGSGASHCFVVEIWTTEQIHPAT